MTWRSHPSALTVPPELPRELEQLVFKRHGLPDFSFNEESLSSPESLIWWPIWKTGALVDTNTESLNDYRVFCWDLGESWPWPPTRSQSRVLARDRKGVESTLTFLWHRIPQVVFEVTLTLRTIEAKTFPLWRMALRNAAINPNLKSILTESVAQWPWIMGLDWLESDSATTLKFRVDLFQPCGAPYVARQFGNLLQFLCEQKKVRWVSPVIELTASAAEVGIASQIVETAHDRRQLRQRPPSQLEH